MGSVSCKPGFNHSSNFSFWNKVLVLLLFERLIIQQKRLILTQKGSKEALVVFSLKMHNDQVAQNNWLIVTPKISKEALWLFW